MSRKIIGVTVGTTLPKPNFKQTDPTKGDYIKNKPDFDGLKNEVSVIKGDLAQAKQEAITYTDKQIESALIYAKNEDIDELFNEYGGM